MSGLKTMHRETDPHTAGRLLSAGTAIVDAAGALVLLHGRGAGAEDILGLHSRLNAANIAALAPEAAQRTWYPHSFLAPIESNQPYLDSALRRIQTLVDDLMSRGVPSERIALLGFSQGACLASEFVARYPRRYGAVMALTGGLIGPEGTPRNYAGSLAGTPVFLGTSDPDPHVRLERVQETQRVLSGMGARVELRSYVGMPHTVNEDEVAACRNLLRKMVVQSKNELTK